MGRRAFPAWAVAALGALAYLVIDPPSADLAAQEYRVGLVQRAGLGLWNNGWYAGHHTPAYSVVFGPLGAAVGVRVTGALAAVAAAALFERLARARWGARGHAGALWFAVGIAALLGTGRLTFILGAAVGLGALLALQSGRRRLAAALAVLTALSSPVAGLFVALAAVAWGLADRDRRGWGAAVAVAALAPALALAGLFPEGGDEPFAASAFWPGLAAIVLVGVLLPARERALRIGAGLYAAGCAATFVLATPLGGNVTRLGALMAGPVLVGALAGRRRVAVLAALALPRAYWQLQAPVRDVARASGDPSVQASYHRPLVRWLQSRPGAFRVEIPFTANHWEAAHVAPYVPLARGWERQVDRRYAPLFYGAELDARTYRGWLDEHAVRYVALPDAQLDYSATAEARLIRRGLPWLRLAWRDAHWRVYAVAGARPLVEGAAREMRLDPDGFVLDAHRAGTALVRVRYTRWWSVTGGGACVEEAPDGMTRVRVRRAGVVRVQARLFGSRCRD
jgi:hypothetical protein